MIFNLEKMVYKSVFTYHKRYFEESTPEEVAKIVDDLCGLNPPNTPIMERITRLLEDNYNIWDRVEMSDWLVNGARDDFRKNNINIYIGQLVDEDSELEVEQQTEEAVSALKRHSVVYHLDSDFDYYEVMYFDNSIRKEAEMMLKMLEVMIPGESPFNIYEL